MTDKVLYSFWCLVREELNVDVALRCVNSSRICDGGWSIDLGRLGKRNFGFVLGRSLVEDIAITGIFHIPSKV